MTTLVQESLTRLVPHGQDEGAYARARLVAERPPWPKVGDHLWFRRHEWDTDEQLHLMVVVGVQDPGDTDSVWATNLWQHLRANDTGEPLFYTDGTPALVPLPDPWPWVEFVWPPHLEIPKGSVHTWKHRPQTTFESRMRGAPGWLPLTYQQTRRTYLPGQTPPPQSPTYRYDPTSDTVQRCLPGGTEWLPYRQR